MTGPVTPAQASTPIPPPLQALQFVDSQGILTPQALSFLQLLWAAIQGGGGIVDIIAQLEITAILDMIAPGFSSAAAQSLAAQSAAPGPLLLSPPPPFPGLPPLPSHDVSPSPVSWSPTIAGSATPGAQTYSTQSGSYCDIGPMRIALFRIAMTALDAATAGNVEILGLPTAASTTAVAVAGGWVGSFANLTLTAGYTFLGTGLSAGSGAILLAQSGSAQPPASLLAAALSATSTLTGGIAYFR